MPRLPDIKLPRPQLPQLTQIHLPRPLFKLPNFNILRPDNQRPSHQESGGGSYQQTQDDHGGHQNSRPKPQGQQGSYRPSQVTCGTSPAPAHYGTSQNDASVNEDRYELAAAAAASAEAFDSGNPFLRAQRDTVHSRERERDMQRLRDAWLQYRGAMLAYEQRYSADDPALLRFKKEVLSSQSLGFSAAAAAGFPFGTAGIPKLVEERGERGFAQEKRDSAIVPAENERNGPIDAGLLGPGYSFMLYPKEVHHHRAGKQTATSRNDAPSSEVPSSGAEQKEEAAAAADDPFDITLSPENVSKLSKILTPLTYAGSHVGKRRGGQPDEEQRAKEIGETSLEP